MLDFMWHLQYVVAKVAIGLSLLHMPVHYLCNPAMLSSVTWFFFGFIFFSSPCSFGYPPVNWLNSRFFYAIFQCPVHLGLALHCCYTYEEYFILGWVLHFRDLSKKD